MPIDPQTLGELINQRWGPLVIWIGPEAWAEDVVQQAFVRLAASEPVPDNPVAWLFAVSRNLAHNERKTASRRRRRHSLVARHESLERPHWDSAEHAELLGMIRRLPSIQREVVVARIWGDLSFGEIAAQLDVSQATAWRTYQEALRQLQSIYQINTTADPT